MTRPRTWTARIAAAVMLVAAFGPQAAPAQTGTLEITIEHYLFDPPYVEVAHGQRIRWVNNESGPLPLDGGHNIVRDIYQPPGGVPELHTRVICNRFEPGGSCSPLNIGTLLPRGRHFLTCTIDRDHSLLMRAIIDVV